MSVHSGSTLLLIGVSHRSTGLAEREALALSLDERMSLQHHWCRSGEADECFVLTTCNRSEFYVVSGDPRRAEASLRSALARLRGRDALGSVTHRYRRINRDASRHLLRVAAGLDSMVLGDVQILGQVRDAYQAARQANAIGPALDRLLQRALCTGRRARAETRIATGNASMPSAVVSLLRSELGTLADRDIAVIGAGETGRLLVTNAMTDRGVRLTVINRTLARAVQLAEEVGGRAAPLDVRRHWTPYRTCSRRRTPSCARRPRPARSSVRQMSVGPWRNAAGGIFSSSTSPCRATSTRTLPVSPE